MKDLKIEYRDGKLVELVIDGEQQSISSMCEVSLTHAAPGPAELRIVRAYISGASVKPAIVIDRVRNSLQEIEK